MARCEGVLTDDPCAPIRADMGELSEHGFCHAAQVPVLVRGIMCVDWESYSWVLGQLGTPSGGATHKRQENVY